MPIQWEIKCYKNRKKIVVVAHWVKNDLSKKAWQSLKRSMEVLAKREIIHWERPHASFVSDSDRIYVIRFKDGNSTQWRIYGFHDSNLFNFVMTNYGTERGNKYDPPADVAAKRAEDARSICYTSWSESVTSCIQRTDHSIMSISDTCSS